MSDTLLIGLDLGTSHVKAAAFCADGERLAEAAVPYPTYYPQPGWAEQAPADWQAAAAAALQALTARLGSRSGQAAALGLSAHAPALVPVDGHGVPLLARVPIWQDERSVEHGHDLLRAIGPEWVGLGMPFAAFPAKLRWFTQAHPALARRAAYALGVKGYLLHWLTGTYATDPSSEPGNSPEWLPVCEVCGWSLDRLAPVWPAAALAGQLLAERARDFGLKPGLPVVVGLNDGASATLGNGALLPGEAVITLGTNGVIYLVADSPVPAPQRLDQAIFCWPYIEARYVLGGQTKCGAASLQWLAGVLQAGQDGFDTMLLEGAGRPPGSRGVMFLPFLMGRGTPKDDPLATGSFVGLTLSADRGDLVTAVLEGVAYTLRDVLEVLGTVHPTAPRLSITGGGARSAMWRQIVADVLNRPLRYSDGESCLGAAMLAAVGVGRHPTIAAACGAMQRMSAETQPRPQAAAAYAPLYAAYCRQRDLAPVAAGG